MINWLPVIIAGSVLAGLAALTGGYVAHSNLNDPEKNRNISTHNNGNLFENFWKITEGGGKKTRHRKHKMGKNTRRK